MLAIGRTADVPPPLVGRMAPSVRSTARPIQRHHRTATAARKPCHTVKNLLMIDPTCHICRLSGTYEGTVPDKSCAELASSTLRRGSCLDQDRGFQGFTLEGITIIQPKKKPPGGELTPSK